MDCDGRPSGPPSNQHPPRVDRSSAAGSADAVPAVVEQAAYLGNTVSYLVRTSGGTGLTVLTPKAGARLPVDSEIAVAWMPPMPWCSAGPSAATRGGARMTQSHDGSSIDLERELTRYLGERRMTRR